MGTEETVVVKEGDTISDLESKIIRQVEYYFGNYNLSKDKFLKHQIKENDGWIPMDTMIKFKRLKELSDDFSVITTALKKSPNKLMEVNEDGTMIRRSLENPLPENTAEQREEVDNRTIYVKGFPSDMMLDELLDFFKPYRDPESIFMRRRMNKHFKGSVFVTFRTKEDAEKFMETDGIRYKSTELIKERKPDYVKKKDEWFDGVRKEREEKQKMKEQRRKDKESETPPPPATSFSEDKIVKGSLLKLSGLGKETMWEHIKEELCPHGSIAYVDYSKGNPEAVVRFDSAVAAEVLEKVATTKDDTKIVKIKDVDAVGVVLEGEEEIEYWKTIAKSKAELKTLSKTKRFSQRGWQSRGGRSGGYRGKGWQRGKRRHDDENGGDDSERGASKMVKKEADTSTEVSMKDADGGPAAKDANSG